jgi:hypothetical protein
LLDDIEKYNLNLDKDEFIKKLKIIFSKLNPNEKQIILQFEQVKKSIIENPSFIPTITYNSNSILKEMLIKRFKDKISN